MRPKLHLWGKVRKAVFFVHLWFGLLLGLYVALVGVTGSAMIFVEEIDAALHPRLHRVEPKGRPISLESAWSAVRQRFPGEPFLRAKITNDLTAPYEFQIGSWDSSAWTSSARHTLRQVFVDPYTGEILAARPRYGTFFAAIFYLHKDLLLGKGGYLLNGYGALFWTALLLSGVWLWWPSIRASRAQWANRLLLRRGASYRRTIHDLHNVAGIYPVGILLLPVLTGAVFVFWQPVQTFVYRISGSPADPLPPKVEGASVRLSLDDAVAIGNRIVPDAPITWVYPVRKSGQTLRLFIEFPKDRYLPRAYVQIHLHPETGRVLAVDDTRLGSRGRHVMNWMGPLHFGTWAAPFGRWADLVLRLMYFAAGIAPLVLFVTGLLKYLEKRKGRHRNRRRHGMMSADERSVDASPREESCDETSAEACVHTH